MMKKKIILNIVFLIMVIMGMKYSVLGAIEIKEGNRDLVIKNLSVSDYYDMALLMKSAGQGLEGVGENVTVHMTNCSEYAAVLNFSNSNYGTAGEGDKLITVNNNQHQSSNREFVRSNEFNLLSSLHFKLFGAVFQIGQNKKKNGVKN